MLICKLIIDDVLILKAKRFHFWTLFVRPCYSFSNLDGSFHHIFFSYAILKKDATTGKVHQ